MTGKNATRYPGSGFTLVELLVVIGIISVLLGILLPAMTRVRTRAQSIACQSNLRQIGIAINLYADRNRDMIPWGTVQFSGGSTLYAQLTWDDMITEDLGTPLSDAELNSDRLTRASQILLCPADPYPPQVFPAPVYGTSSIGAQRRSYAIVRCLPTFGLSDQFLGVASGIWVDGGGGPAPSWGNMTVKDLTLPRAKILDSAETLLIVEAPSNGNFAGGELAMADRPQDQFWGLSLGNIALTPASTSKTPHGSTWNYLFCDGHVAPLAWNETVRDSGDFTTNLQSMNYLWTRNPND